MMKVFITREIPSVAEEFLKKKNIGISVFKKDRQITKQELIKGVKGADAVLSLLTDKIDKDVIDAMKGCRVIANYAAGYNNIDIEYAGSKGIVVTNTPSVLTDATADLAMTLALACARCLNEGEAIMRSGKFEGWKPKLLLGIELRNKYFGIIGAGRIGQGVAERAVAFGAKILYTAGSRKEAFEKKTGAKKVTLEQLLKKSDFVSLHVPLTDKTRTMLNKEKLHLLKETAILINTARGEVIDEIELIKMLKANRIFAAGFDVYINEPAINPAFLKLKNVVLLPHLGSATVDTRNNMALLAVKNIDAVLRGKKALTPVNM